MAAAIGAGAADILLREIDRVRDDPLLFVIRVLRYAGAVFLGGGVVLAIAAYEGKRSASQASNDATNRFKQIQSSFAKISGAFGNLQPLKPIKLAAMPNFAQGLQAPLEDLSNGANQIAHGADPSQVQGAMKNAWDQVTAWFQDAAQNGVGGISNDTLSAVKSAGSTLDSWFGGAATSAGDIVNGVKNVLQGALGAIGATLEDIGKALGAIGTDLLQGFEDVGVALEDVGKALEDIPPAIVAFGQALLTAITSAPFILWDELVAGVGGAFADLADWLYPFFLIFGGVSLGISIVLSSVRTYYLIGIKPAFDTARATWADRQQERIWTPLFDRLFRNPGAAGPPRAIGTTQTTSSTPSRAPEAVSVSGQPSDKQTNVPETALEGPGPPAEPPAPPEPPAAPVAPAAPLPATREDIEELLGQQRESDLDHARAALREAYADWVSKGRPSPGSESEAKSEFEELEERIEESDLEATRRILAAPLET